MNTKPSNSPLRTEGLELEQSLALRAQLQNLQQVPGTPKGDLNMGQQRERALLTEALAGLTETDVDDKQAGGWLGSEEHYHWIEEPSLLWGEDGQVYETHDWFQTLFFIWVLVSILGGGAGSVSAIAALFNGSLDLASLLAGGVLLWVFGGSLALSKLKPVACQAWTPNPRRGKGWEAVRKRMTAAVEEKLIQHNVMSKRERKDVHRNPRTREVLGLLEAWTRQETSNNLQDHE